VKFRGALCGQWLLHCLKGTGALALMGCLLGPLEDAAWDQVRPEVSPTGRIEHLEPVLGQGVVLAVLGGFRAMVANALFIRGYVYWEERDAVATEAMLSLATEIEPASMYFWINRARMVGYDFAIWRIDELGGFATVPEYVQQQLMKAEAERAMAILQRAELFHPHRFEISLEMARLSMNRLQDRERAAHWFGVAAEMEGAPYFVQRLYAQMLYETGRVAQAYRYLRKHLRSLPAADPMAARRIVVQRIRALEDALGMKEPARLPLQLEEVE